MSSFQGLKIYVLNNVTNANGKVSDSFVFVWGPNGYDRVGIYYPISAVGDTSLNSLWILVNQGLSNSMNDVDYKPFFDVGWDACATVGAQGVLSTFTFIPSLAISQPGTSMALSWPTNAPGYELQSSLLLGTDANWTTVTNAPIITNRQNQITLPCTGFGGFFRMQRTN
jgi:hypothetical protein